MWLLGVFQTVQMPWLLLGTKRPLEPDAITVIGAQFS